MSDKTISKETMDELERRLSFSKNVKIKPYNEVKPILDKLVLNTVINSAEGFAKQVRAKKGTV